MILDIDKSPVLDIKIHRGAKAKVYFTLSDDEGEFDLSSYILVSKYNGDTPIRIDSTKGLEITAKQIKWTIEANFMTSNMIYQAHFFNTSLRTLHGKIITTEAITE